MKEFSFQDLQQADSELLDRVQSGETVFITRGGKRVATLSQVPVAPLSVQELLARWGNVAPIDGQALRADLEGFLNFEFPSRQ